MQCDSRWGRHLKFDRIFPFLPACRDDMDALGWSSLDFLFVSGDAYIDHPSFAAALIGRWLELNGYQVNSFQKTLLPNGQQLVFQPNKPLSCLMLGKHIWAYVNISGMIATMRFGERPEYFTIQSPY